MIHIIRGILQTFVKGIYNIFTAEGMSDEIITGTYYQHYGFWSYPPKGTEVISLQYGQNNISIAENSGDIFGPQQEPQEGDVYLYSKSGIIFSMPGNMNSVALRTKPDSQGKNYSVEINEDQKLIDISTPTQRIIIDETNGLIGINGNFQVLKTPLIPGSLEALATATFVDDIRTFMLACAAATDPHASEIKAAAASFNLNTPTNFYTQATKAL